MMESQMWERPDLLAKVTSQIIDAVRIRDDAAYGRAIQGAAPVDLTICLGSGRCLFPRQGHESRICAFCYRYPSNRGSGAKGEPEKVAKIFCGGH